MKTIKLILIFGLMFFAGMFLAAKSSEERVQIRRTVTVKGDEAALDATRAYLKDGASRVFITPPFRLASDEIPHEWEVEAVFYK